MKSTTTNIQTEYDDIKSRAQRMLEMRCCVNKIMTSAYLGSQVGMRYALDQFQLPPLLAKNIRPTKTTNERVLTTVAPKVLRMHRFAHQIEHVVRPHARYAVNGTIEDFVGSIRYRPAESG